MSHDQQATTAAPVGGARTLYLLLPFTVLLGSFLMFALEPLIGKIVTPAYGGTAAIWSTCLFFFQFAVLCGYALTYYLSRLSFERYILVYAGMAAISIGWMRVPLTEQWIPSATGDPVAQLLTMLIVYAGVPSILLSSISGTIQVWYRNLKLGDPYPLYSVSNVGSLGALLAYPLVLEPNLTVRQTIGWWGNLYVLLVAVIACSALLSRRRASSSVFSSSSLQGLGADATASGTNASRTDASRTPAPRTADPPSPSAADLSGEPRSAADGNAASNKLVRMNNAAKTKKKRKRSAKAGPDTETERGTETQAGPQGGGATAGAAAAGAAAAEAQAQTAAAEAEAEAAAQAQASSAVSAAEAATAAAAQASASAANNAETAAVTSEKSPKAGSITGAGQESSTLGLPEVFHWVTLSMLGSLVLLTQTAHITSDIAPVPLLWIAPLAIYLTTFILVFASPIFYLPRIYTYAWPAIGVVEILMGKTDLLFKLGLNLLNVFLLCMICNGELAAAKPPANRLPLYWLCTSIGGVLAGLFVSVLAPLVFSFDLERHLTYCMMIILTLTVIKKRKLFILGYKPTTYSWVGWSSAVLLLLIAGDTLATDTIYRERNFYGSVQVKEDGTYRELVNGQILHGQQFLKPEHRMIPGSYFQLPIAFVDTFLRWRSRGARQEYGVVGLGVGTIAAYGRKGDSIDYFEIDPKIIKIAQSFFSYISGSKATVKLIPGDARATIKALPTEKRYDLLVIDAFNGDAVPVHLLTTEAIQIYLSHVKPDGILMFHVSNRFINLIPPVSSSARTLGLHPLVLDDIASLYVAFVRSDSEIKAMKDCISGNHELLKDLMVQDVPPSTAKGWTDDFANLASYFQFK